MNDSFKTIYFVIAHCKDGDVKISPKGVDFYENLKDAKKAKRDHKNLGCNIEIIEHNIKIS